ncbi:thioredoxin-dependent thiol peroxidase [Breznakia sp. OttesenSCG-928-G09]|nr:thioredoxin-dependent thiol peroxidase [Breznakia sp. OttesenSCG-928-G09]
MLEVGQKAFDFDLFDKDGIKHKLSDYLGKKVVVYFYPKDDTPGCVKEACAFRNTFQDFKDRDVVVIGISKDSQESHRKFAEKYNLPFIILSDPELEAIQAYGVWVEKNMYGKKYMGVNRSTFIVDEQGEIIKVYKKATPDKNAEEIIAFLEGK